MNYQRIGLLDQQQIILGKKAVVGTTAGAAVGVVAAAVVGVTEPGEGIQFAAVTEAVAIFAPDEDHVAGAADWTGAAGHTEVEV